MPAKKVTKIECTDIDVANRLVTDMATELRAARVIKLELEEKIQLLQEEASKKIDARTKKAKALAASVYAFAAKKRTELEGDRKSITLAAGGSFGWRSSPGILEIEDIDATVAELERTGRESLVRVEKSVDREALGKLPDVIEKLEGVQFAYPETFFIKPPETEERLECSVEGRHTFSIVKPKKKS